MSLASPPATGSHPKGHRRGTHRAVAPAETLERLASRLPVAGITRIADVTGLDRIGIPVVMVVRPNARSLSVTQGKGLDLDAARTSGVMEAIEHRCAETVEAPLYLGSRFTLASRGGLEATLDPTDLPRLATSPWSDDHRTLWVAAERVAAERVAAESTAAETPEGEAARALFIPYELVHLDFTLPLPEGSGCFPMSSSGLASGNHSLEATCHALCELIERDAVTLRNQLGKRPPTAGQAGAASRRLDLDSVEDEACREVLARYRDAAVDVAVWEATSEIGVPVFDCAILDAESVSSTSRGVAAGGSGCHLDPAIALVRALTEAAQSRVTMIAGARDDLDRDAYARWRDPAHLAALRQRFQGERCDHRFAADASQAGDDFASDLATLLARLRRAGFPTALRVDLTPAWLADAASVVRVLVPGLEGLADLPGAVPGGRLRRAAARSLAPPIDRERGA